MEPNSKSQNIINLKDRADYKSILIESITELQEIELKFKKIAINLLAKSEYSSWNNNVAVGHVQEIKDSVFEKSDDQNVKELYSIALMTNKLLNRINEDNKR